MENNERVLTRCKNVFDFQTAVQQGAITDQKGRAHTLVAHGERFLITNCEGEEYCFDSRGDQKDTFPSVKLTSPVMVEETLMPYIVYNEKTLTAISGYLSIQRAHSDKEKANDENVRLLNTTHRLNKPVLKSMGLGGYPKITRG